MLVGVLVIAITVWFLRVGGPSRAAAPMALLGSISVFYSVAMAIGLLDIVMFAMSFVIFAPAVILTGMAAKAGLKVISGALVFGPLIAFSVLVVIGSLIES